jgi:ATP-dependent DNA helicase HFM1/MER3
MIGRAGRPGFDKNGIAVILTDSESEGSFTTANTDNPLQADYVESRLQDILIEAICTEITQIVITNVRGVMIWLKHSLFFIRVQKNPEHYGYNQFLTAGELDNQLERTCISILENLSNAGLIEVSLSSIQKYISFFFLLQIETTN